MSFLPQGYEPPSSGNYMKFSQGKNRFRILSSAIVGNMFWRSDGDSRVPVRRRIGEPIQAEELEQHTDGTHERPKHFWAFVVWNYATNQLQILEITQRTIQQSIKALVDDPDWGDPTGYDINVTRAGSGLDTDYQVQPSPQKLIPEEVAAAYKAASIDLEALFAGGDPFGGSTASKKPSHGPLSSAGTNGRWTLDQAIAKASEAGIDRAEVIGALKKLGRTGWNPERDTSTVQTMIREKRAQSPFEGKEAEFTEAEIPF